MTQPAANNSAVITRLDNLLQVVQELKDRFDAAEQIRQAFRSEYDRSSGDTAKVLAVIDHRLTAAERRIEANALAIVQLTRSVESLSTIVKFLTGAFTTIGSAAGLWLLGQLLGLIK